MSTMPAQRIGIVGGGILGLATARALLRRDPRLQVTVLEKEPEVARHQTGRNSGVVHAGIYYAPGSLKARLCTRGVTLLRDFCARHDITYDECGKVIVAVDEAEVAQLDQLHARGRANGVPDLRLLSGSELREVEPHVSGLAALHSPRTAIVSFAAVARAVVDEIAAAGGQVHTGTAVRTLRHRDGAVIAATDAGDFRFDRLVTCAGLYADRLAVLAGDEPDPRIVPFRGDYFLLRPSRRQLVRGLVYPVPDPRYPFLGIHLTRRVDGEVLVGPNAVLAFAREGYRFGRVSPADLAQTLAWPGFRRLARQHWRMGAKELFRALSRRGFAREAQRYVPELRADDLVRGPAGVRAQALDASGQLVEDFRITHQGRIVSVRNAPSPAATSSLAIAEVIREHVLDGAETRSSPALS